MRLVLHRRVRSDVDASAELSFLLQERFWGRGYATEAAGRLVRYGFERFKLNRISARHLASNTASAQHISVQKKPAYPGES